MEEHRKHRFLRRNEAGGGLDAAAAAGGGGGGDVLVSENCPTKLAGGRRG